MRRRGSDHPFHFQGSGTAAQGFMPRPLTDDDWHPFNPPCTRIQSSSTSRADEPGQADARTALHKTTNDQVVGAGELGH